MAVNGAMVWVLLALAAVNLALVAWVLVELGRSLGRMQGGEVQAQLQRKELQDLRALLQSSSERLERELRREESESGQSGR